MSFSILTLVTFSFCVFKPVAAIDAQSLGSLYETFKGLMLQPKTNLKNIFKYAYDSTQFPPLVERTLKMDEHTFFMNGAVQKQSTAEVIVSQQEDNLKLSYARCAAIPKHIEKTKRQWKEAGTITVLPNVQVDNPSTCYSIPHIIDKQIGYVPRGLTDNYGGSRNSDDLISGHLKEIESLFGVENIKTNQQSLPDVVSDEELVFLAHLFKHLMLDAFIFHDPVHSWNVLESGLLFDPILEGLHKEYMIFRERYGNLWFNWRRAVMVSSKTFDTELYKRSRFIISSITEMARLKRNELNIPIRLQKMFKSDIWPGRKLFELLKDADMLNYFIGFPEKLKTVYNAYQYCRFNEIEVKMDRVHEGRHLKKQGGLKATRERRFSHIGQISEEGEPVRHEEGEDDEEDEEDVSAQYSLGVDEVNEMTATLSSAATRTKRKIDAAKKKESEQYSRRRGSSRGGPSKKTQPTRTGGGGAGGERGNIAKKKGRRHRQGTGIRHVKMGESKPVDPDEKRRQEDEWKRKQLLKDAEKEQRRKEGAAEEAKRKRTEDELKKKVADQMQEEKEKREREKASGQSGSQGSAGNFGGGD